MGVLTFLKDNLTFAWAREKKLQPQWTLQPEIWKKKLSDWNQWFYYDNRNEYAIKNNLL